MATITKTSAIYVRDLVNGVYKYRRMNFNLVTVDKGGSALTTNYIEPAAYALFTSNADEITFDDLKVFDQQPWPNSVIGLY